MTKYDTIAGVPTKGNEFAQLIERLRLAQENCTILAHLHRDDSKLMAQGWLAVAENLRKTQHIVTQLATKGLQ